MSQLMQERYGTTSRRRRLLLTGATTVLGALFLGWVVWAAWLHSNPALDAVVVKYRVNGSHQVLVQLDTHFRNADVRGSCLLRATASDHTVVGERDVDAAILRSQEGKWISVRTEREATTVELVRCQQSP